MADIYNISTAGRVMNLETHEINLRI